MAVKKIYIGEYGPFLYDDSLDIDDPDGDLSGVSQKAFATDGDGYIEGNLDVIGDLDITGDVTVGGSLTITGTVTFSGNVAVAEGASFTCDNVTTRISQGITGLTPTDHPTFDYITLTTSQGVTGLTTTDYPLFEYIRTTIVQGVVGLMQHDHPTFDYINLTTAQGVTGLTTGDSPHFVELSLTGTLSGHQINPSDDNMYDLGESGRRWQDGHIINVYSTTVTVSGNFVLPDGGNLQVADGDPKITFDDSNGWIRVYCGGDEIVKYSNANFATYKQPLFTGIADAGTDTDKFLVLTIFGELKYRTGAETLSDIGGAASSHTHDDRYYTETELDGGQLDNRYYTETEVDNLLAAQDALSELGDVTISGPADNDVLQYDNGSSKWVDRTLAEAGISAVGHTHDDRYYTETEVDALTWDASDIVSGTLVHEQGGLEADVSAYAGLVKISGGSTSAVTDNSTNWNTAYGWGDHAGLYAAIAHKDTHDPNDGADPLDTAAAGEIVGVAAAATGTAHSFARSDHTHQVQHSIADNHIVTIDGTANQNEHAIFGAGGIAGLTDAELLAALSGDAGAAFDWNTQDVTGARSLSINLAALDTTDSYTALDVDVTKTAGASGEEDDIFGVVCELTMNQNGGTVGNLTGGYFSTLLTDGTLGDGQEDLTGMSSIAKVTSGTVSRHAIGQYTFVNLDGGSIGSDIYGLSLKVDVESAVTSIGGSVFGIYLDMDLDKDPTGTAYLAFLSAGDNIDYGLYAAGNIKNYIQGTLGIGVAAGQAAKLHIDQSSTTGAIPVLTLDQADVSEEFIKFIGAASGLGQSLVAAVYVGSATLIGYYKIYVQDDGNQMTDLAYYVPFYTLSS